MFGLLKLSGVVLTGIWSWLSCSLSSSAIVFVCALWKKLVVHLQALPVCWDRPLFQVNSVALVDAILSFDFIRQLMVPFSNFSNRKQSKDLDSLYCTCVPKSLSALLWGGLSVVSVALWLVGVLFFSVNLLTTVRDQFPLLQYGCSCVLCTFHSCFCLPTALSLASRLVLKTPFVGKASELLADWQANFCYSSSGF